MENLKIIDITVEGDISFVSFLIPSLSAVGDVEAMAKALRGYVADNRPEKVVVDFSGLKFFSSQVLGLLVEMWKKLKEYGGCVVISGINPELGRVFKITNLDSLFDFYPDNKSAVEALGRKA
ncbi:MAG: STAS domain-containing protein [Planctomycetes bacterium]|nr:STAS domain-containing protein [Planctomycetota bacterium]